MDVGTVVGKSFYSFTGQDGRIIEGYKFHCTLNAPLSDPSFQGVQVATYNVSVGLMQRWKAMDAFVPDVDDAVVIRYNRYGKIEQFEAMP